jgi:hypothetical protein
MRQRWRVEGKRMAIVLNLSDRRGGRVGGRTTSRRWKREGKTEYW